MEGERNIHKWCDRILVLSRQRCDVENNKKNLERHVAEKGQWLER